MTAVERADRARRIAEAKVPGMTWTQVAARFGVSEKTARRAAKAWVEGTLRITGTAAPAPAPPALRPADLDPQAIFVKVVTTYVDALDELEALAGGADSSAAAVGARKAQIAAGTALLNAFALVGLLPDASRVLLARAEERRARAAIRERDEMLVRGAT